MSITYGYFNSVNGDRRYNADQMSQYFKGLISNGVYANLGGSMAVIADGATMTVNVSTGRAVIDCRWIENDAAYPLTITQAHATLPRYTAVVVQLDSEERLIRITTKDGTPAETPTEPEIDSETELCLAMILVPAGSSMIIQSRVTDKRGTSLCLWVTGLITQLDTNQLFLQWQSLFDDWFDSLTEELNVNTFLKCYRKDYVFESEGTKNILLDMAGYIFAWSDIINVYINGLLATEDVDYSFDSEALTITPVAEASGTEVTIEVLKSKIGYEILAGNGVAVTDENDNTIGLD